MSHDPERASALYLGGGMSEERRTEFLEHMLTCDDCWVEVAAATEGRRRLEAVRVTAPPDLRDRVRALIEAEQADQPTPAATALARRRTLIRRVLTAAAVLLLVPVIWAAVDGSDDRRADPPALQAAIADFRAESLPGRGLPATAAPDLSALRLRTIGAGTGEYDGLEVDGYAYRDDTGRRIVLYISDEPFPTAAGAQPEDDPDGSWVVDRDGVVVLCARAPHGLLVVGEDGELVRSTAAALGVT